jgi:GntR family transcriptional regulator
VTLQIEVDLTAGVPPYEQIRSQIVAHVSAERLRVGDRLPTIRALAADLGVAAGTVARAYRELEQAGVVATRRRSGTVVAAGAVAADVLVRHAASTFVATVRAARLTDDAIIDLVRGALLEPAPTGDRHEGSEVAQPDAR